ncbi:hypothetical protein GCM10010466_68090 [Planomonospora alba]|uniref:Sensor-like histidine kinase SenX3 n=1 Tax=Planomonospora alba TaxID=161354 RepID=A0ABP6P5M1_9ACTN
MTARATPGSPAGEGAPGRDDLGALRAAAPRRTLVFAVLYAVAVLAGRLTIIEGAVLGLVWPAAGVAALWFLAQRHVRPFWPDAAVFALVTFALNVWTGASPVLAGTFVAGGLAQAWAFLLLCARLFPEWWPSGGMGRIERARQLWALLLAAGGSALCSTALSPLAVWIVGDRWSALTASVWLVRNAVGTVLVAGAGLCLAARFGPGAGGARVLAAVRDELRRASGWRIAEYGALAAASVAAYALGFGAAHGLPLAFPLLVVTVWAGVRFPTAFVAVHNLLVGAAALLFTLYGHGPFATIGSPAARVLVAQSFVAMVAVVGLVLALNRDDHHRLLRRLASAEEAASAQAGLLATIVDAMHDGVVVVDARGRFLMRNRAAGDLLDAMGAPAAGPAEVSPVAAGEPGGRAGNGGQEERVDVERFGLFHPDGRLMTDEELPYRRVLAGHEVTDTDMLVRNPLFPEGRVFSVSAARLPGVADDAPAVVVVFHDVTAERRDRDELAAFAGVVAHDLRNPLTAVEGWVDVLAEEIEDAPGGAPAGAEESLSRIRASAARMRNLINDLLVHTVTRDVALAPEPVDLAEAVREIVDTRGDDVAARRAGRPEPRFHVDAPHRVRADPALLRQLLDNLIGNAVKYVAPGTAPDITVTSAPAQEGWVRVEVADRGIGIPAGQHEAVFENFHRAHRGGGYTGSGLGLAICRRIVERHGGVIGVADDPGGGTRFHFTLPAAP